MKKFLCLFLLAVLFLLPFGAFAEGEEEATTAAEDDNRVPVYLFRGEGCPHCQEAEEWFKSIEGEHGSKFKVVDYETWYNEENAKLMEKVASARGETAEGVPYIIIGEKSWNGFTSSYEEEILAQIDTVYNQAPADRYDIIKRVADGKTDSKDAKEEKSSSNDVLVLIVVLIVLATICYAVYRARSNSN